MALDFASAKNPGGGFLRGAKAQEEDLARCSALTRRLVEQREYYDQNRACGSFLYTDHIIYSPDVPFFRDEQHALLDRPFALSIITAPAPNAGEAFQRDDAADQGIRAALERRADMVLAAAGAHGHRCLVLGRGGAASSADDPREVADVFARCSSARASAARSARGVRGVRPGRRSAELPGLPGAVLAGVGAHCRRRLQSRARRHGPARITRWEPPPELRGRRAPRLPPPLQSRTDPFHRVRFELSGRDRRARVMAPT